MPLPERRLDETFRNLASRFEQDRDAKLLLESRTEAVDALVKDAAARCFPSPEELPFFLCAVGGYGRCELFPYSDIDLLIAVDSEAALNSLAQPLSGFLRELWDEGLRVSHSVRTIAECSRLQGANPELHVSLLDRRFLAGGSAMWNVFTGELDNAFGRYSSTIVSRLVDLTRARHAKFNNTIFHLEPNIKETCGAIRDLHLVRWLAKLMPHRDLLQETAADFNSGEAGGQFASPLSFLFAQRVFLHLKTRRDANLLTFELQDQSARLLPDEPTPPQDWMRRYFGFARRVFQTSLRALDLTENESRSPVSQLRERQSFLSTEEFTVLRERILLRNPAGTLHSPAALLQLFCFAGRHGLRLAWDTQRLFSQALPSLESQFQSDPPPWSAWRELFIQPHASLALDEMQKTGLLPVAIPAWEAIDSLVVRDFYHRYTVDEHTLVAIQTIDNLVNQASHTPARLRQLMAEEERAPLLRIALLLHDLGKGTRPGEHVRGSVETAPAVMDRLGVPPEDQASIQFLIAHHLDLSMIMTGRDLEDPATARFLTSRVETQEDLRRLTLVTYADISAVNTTAMTPWRLEQLWHVYLLGSQQLTRELASNRLHRVKHIEALKECSPALSEFLEGFPKRYLRTHPAEEINRHAELASISKQEGVALTIEPEAGFWLLTVLADDHPGLFASLCGVLASFGMNILKGEASSNASGTALDVFRFSDPNQTLELNREEVNRLQRTVEGVVRGTLEVSDLLKRRRSARRFTSESMVAPTVEFNNQASDSATLIDFQAEDRPGLLYDLASTISRNDCNIDVVMIDTEAHKAIDVFYVTCRGCKLDAPAQQSLRANLLKAASSST